MFFSMSLLSPYLLSIPPDAQGHGPWVFFLSCLTRSPNYKYSSVHFCTSHVLVTKRIFLCEWLDTSIDLNIVYYENSVTHSNSPRKHKFSTFPFDSLCSWLSTHCFFSGTLSPWDDRVDGWRRWGHRVPPEDGWLEWCWSGSLHYVSDQVDTSLSV